MPAAMANTRVGAPGGVAKTQAAVAPGPRPVLKNSSFTLAAQPLIVVYVGADDNMTDFDIHKNVLVDKSPFFAAALVEAAGAETQGGTLTTYLEESDPAAFSHVVEWMCKDRVGLQEHGDLIKTYLDKKVEHHTTVHDWLGKGRPEDDVEDEAVYKRYVKDVMKELDDRALNYIGGLETGRLSQYA